MSQDQASPQDLEHRAEALKERVYVTFTALAVVLALGRHPEDTTPLAAALTLTVTVVGTLLAVSLADVIAHMVLHQSLPDRAELRHIVSVSVAALPVLGAPLVLLAIAATGLVTLGWALTAMSGVLVLTLLVVTLFAVRRLRISAGQQLLVLALIGAVGLLVVVLELAVH